MDTYLILGFGFFSSHCFRAQLVVHYRILPLHDLGQWSPIQVSQVSQESVRGQSGLHFQLTDCRGAHQLKCIFFFPLFHDHYCHAAMMMAVTALFTLCLLTFTISSYLHIYIHTLHTTLRPHCDLITKSLSAEPCICIYRSNHTP